MFYYETESNAEVERWIQNHLKPEEKDHKIEVDNVHVPKEFAASTMIHFLRLLHQQKFAVDAHADFRDYVRVTNRRVYPAYIFPIVVLKKLYSLKSKDHHDMLKMDDSDDDMEMNASPQQLRMVSIQELDGLTEDDVCDVLDQMYGMSMHNVHVDDLLEDPDAKEEIEEAQESLRVILINKQDSSYWACGKYIF